MYHQLFILLLIVLFMVLVYFCISNFIVDMHLESITNKQQNLGKSRQNLENDCGKYTQTTNNIHWKL